MRRVHRCSYRSHLVTYAALAILIIGGITGCKENNDTYAVECSTDNSINTPSFTNKLPILHYNISGYSYGETGRNNKGRHAVVDRLLCEISKRRPMLISLNEACEEQVDYLKRKLEALEVDVASSFVGVQRRQSALGWCKDPYKLTAAGNAILVLGDWRVGRPFTLMVNEKGAIRDSRVLGKPCAALTTDWDCKFERGGACLALQKPVELFACSFHLDKESIRSRPELEAASKHLEKYGSAILVGDMNIRPEELFPAVYDPSAALGGSQGSGSFVEIDQDHIAASGSADLGRPTHGVSGRDPKKFDYAFGTSRNWVPSSDVETIDGGDCYLGRPCSDHVMLYGSFKVPSAKIPEKPPAEPDSPSGGANAYGRDVIGTWVGSYHCRQGLTGLRLSIKAARDGRLRAVFNFHAVPTNPQVPSGSFAMKGAFSGEKLVLKAGRWIKRPHDYLTVDLSGGAPKQGVLSGTIDTDGCSSFLLRRS